MTQNQINLQEIKQNLKIILNQGLIRTKEDTKGMELGFILTITVINMMESGWTTKGMEEEK